MRGEERVTACFFGDGAVAEGAFHESMNLAALWKLPVAFFCENNYYAMGTAIERYESQPDLCVKAASYGMEAFAVDGMDVVASYEGASRARKIALAGAPVFVEFRTYRFRAHSMFDPDLYRDKAEIEEWKTRGPIHTFTARLKEQGHLTEERFLEIDAQVDAEVGRAVAFAEAGTWEPVEDLAKDLYAP
jgi:pyruvate dehydrogenase E1 component alpha subunit